MAGKQIQEVCVVAVFGWELKGQGFVFVGTLIVGFISQQSSVIITVCCMFALVGVRYKSE